MGCNCGKRRINAGATSVNQPEAQTTAAVRPTQVTQPTQRERVEASRARVAAAAVTASGESESS